MRTGFNTVSITQYLRLKNSITKRIAYVKCFVICMLALLITLQNLFDRCQNQHSQTLFLTVRKAIGVLMK